MKRGTTLGVALAAVVIAVAGTGWWVSARPPSPPQSSATPPGEPTTTSGTHSPSPTPKVPNLAWGPSQDDWDAALMDAQALSLEDVAGQVIMADISHPDAAAAAKLVKSRHLAGVLIMGGAVTSAKQVLALNQAIQTADPKRDWPVVIATDEEGGVVQRLRPAIGYVSAFMAAGANGDSSSVRAYYAGLGAQMRELNFTMDMAPDADVTIGLEDPTIRTRSAGSDAQDVADTVVAAWQGLDSGGVLPVLKHFPGHGSVTVDSHAGLPRQKAKVATLADRDFVPFKAAIDAGAPAIMMAHIRVPEWGKAPASVNPRAYAYVREELGFTGLIVTDAMNMEAITDRYKPGAATVAAIRAGADLVLMPANTDAAIDALVGAVEKGSLDRARLDDAAAHVILASRWGYHAQDAVAPGRPRDFVEGSIVVAAKDCDALAGHEVTITGGNAAQRKTLAAALRDHGVKVGKGGTTVALVRGDRGHAKADVVVAMGGPWGLPASHAKAYVAIWGEGSEQLRALAAVLAGDVPARGTWPVALKLPYAECSA